MKKLLFIWVLFVGGMISCRQEENPSFFDKVERYMEVYPDSALLLLDQLPHPEKLHGKQRADYALLLTQARDKNHLDSLQSDSIIKIAVDYYRNSEDKVKAGEALFYYGKIMALQDSVATAMQAFLDAEKLLEGTLDYKQKTLLQEYIGYLNYDQGVYETAIDNYLKSIYYGKKANDSLRVIYGYRNIAQVYVAKLNMDSARWYAEYGINLLKGNSTIEALPSLLQVLGIVERNEGNFSGAINNFLRAIKFEKESYMIYHYYFSLGEIYMQIGSFEKAKSYFERGLISKQLYTQAGAYNYLFLLEKKKGDYAKALFYKEKSDSLLSITQDEKLRNQILTLQRRYERDKLIMEKRQLEQENQVHIYLFVLILLAVIIVCLTSFLIMKKIFKEHFKRNINIIKENENIINQYVYQLEDLKRKENEVVKNHKEKIGKLNQKILLLTNENKAIRENICVNAVFLLDQLKKRTLIAKRMTKNEKAQIFEYVDLLFGNFISRLKSEYELTENNIMLVSLLKMGFTSRELMFIFDCEMNSVFRMKQRLKERLHLSSDSKLEEFIALY